MNTKLTTKQRILSAGVDLAEEVGYLHVKMSDVAQAAGVVNGTVIHHFLRLEILRQEILKYAVGTKNLKIIAQALVSGDKATKQIPKKLKREALEYVTN